MRSRSVTVSLGLLVVLAASPAAAETYYVATSGDDGAAGDSAHPWRSVQHAADSLRPGDEVLVQEGRYEEDVVVDSSGDDGNPITIRGIAAGTSLADMVWSSEVNSFVIAGDHVIIADFDVQTYGNDETGIAVRGSHVTIRNNFVHECANRGIRVGYEADDVRVLANLVHHNGIAGIETYGSNSLFEDNEISETVQWHPRHVGTTFMGEDADGFRIFGSGHVIRHNYVHDIANPDDPGNHQGYLEEGNEDYPHPDCIQTWDVADGRYEQCMTNAIIEGNYFHVAAYAGKGIIVSSTSSMDSTCENIIVRNNIFEFRDCGICAYGIPIASFTVDNNLFKARPTGVEDWGFGIILDAVGYEVYNNIFVDCVREARTLSGSGVVDYNLIWSSDDLGSVGAPARQPNEIRGEDPLFVSYSPSHGNDYHLRESSPARDSGTAAADVSQDRDGHPRPYGPAFDIGPYEYSPCTPASCDELSYECGSWDDGCGATLDCGSCEGGWHCDTSGRCVADPGDAGLDAGPDADGPVGRDADLDTEPNDGAADADEPATAPSGSEGCDCQVTGGVTPGWRLVELLLGL